MKEDKILRLSIITRTGNTSTFNSSLIKLITMVLYESEIFSLSLDEIRNSIELNYELEFTNEEILNAINSKDYGIYKIHERKEIRNGSIKNVENINKYRLEDKIINKLKEYEDRNVYYNIIDEFITKFGYENSNSKDIGDLINKYLYNVFNSNKDTMLLLLKSEERNLMSIENFADNNEKEKEIINNFLNWDNPSKNELIFQTVSYCVDYCMLTIRKDHSSFSHLFKGKVFYLDANIIFRMAGINNQERKIVTNSFINKCIENGIEIRYTNITYEEIRNTVNKQVQGLKDMLGGFTPVSTSNYTKFSKPSANIELIVKYDNWLRSKNGKQNDFLAFEKYMQREIDIILDKFNKVEFMSYEATAKDEFLSLSESLMAYKSSKNANYTADSIKIDINNFLYVYNLRKSSRGLTFLDISDYIISADGKFCEWGKEVMPSTIPIVVLPSVWHSLLLRFRGRANKDYEAFTLFLNLRYKVSDEGFDTRRPKILSIVQKMDEPVNIKNLILDEISDNLTEKYSDDSDEIEIIEKAKNTVIEKEIERIYEDDGKKLINEGIAEGKLQTLYKIAESNVNKKILRNNFVSKCIDYSRLALGVIVCTAVIILISLKGLSFISKSMKTEVLGYDLLSWSSIIGIGFAMIMFLIMDPIKKIYKSSSNEEMLEEEIKKIKKKISLE